MFGNNQKQLNHGIALTSTLSRSISYRCIVEGSAYSDLLVFRIINDSLDFFLNYVFL